MFASPKFCEDFVLTPNEMPHEKKHTISKFVAIYNRVFCAWIFF